MANPSPVDSAPRTSLDKDVKDALTNFAKEQTRTLREYLSEKQVDVDALRDLPRWNTGRESNGDKPAVVETPDQIMNRAITAVVSEPAGAALLGLHVWDLCGEAWEQTYRFSRLIGTLKSFEKQWRKLRSEDEDELSRIAGDAAAVLTETLVLEVELESALCRGDLVRHAAAADQVIEGGERLSEIAARIDDGLEQFRDILAEQADSLITYHRAVKTAAEAAAAALNGAPGVYDGINALRDAESEIGSDLIYRSELRAHRRNLDRIAAASADEWLTVEHAKIVYLYPFGINHLSAQEAVEIARAETAPKIGDVTADSVRRSFNLDDVWAGSDYLHRRFDGAAIELPTVTLAHLDGEKIADLDAEVRISELGNHYLRLEGEIEDYDPHQLHFAFFRAASEHTSIRADCKDGRWECLSDFAEHIQNGVAQFLTDQVKKLKGLPETTEPKEPESDEDPEKQMKDPVARPGRYHVLLSILEAGAGRGPGVAKERRRPVESGEELLGLFGSQALLSPVPNGISAICDWATAAVDEEKLLRNLSREGDLVAPTVNSTVTAFLSSPGFIIGMFETVAEFVGTLDGLFSGWHDRLAEHHQNIKSLINEANLEEDVAKLGKRAKELRTEQLELHNFAAEARSVISLIHSPNLMTSPRDAETLAQLMRAAEFDRQELDFASKLRELLGDRLEMHIDALAEERQKRLDQERERQERINHGMVQSLLAAVAAFGMAGVIQILQSSGLVGEFVAWASVVFIFAMAAVICFFVFRRTTRVSGAQT